VSLLLTPGAGAATLIGTYGLSGVAALAAGLLFLLYRRHWRGGGGLALAVAALVGTALVASPAPQGEPGAAVRIVQPNVSQEEKHGAGYEPKIRERLSGLSMKEPTADARLVLWPEDAMPYILDEEPGTPQELAGWIGPNDLLLTGAAKIERSADGWAVGARNSVYVIDAAGRLRSRYDKAHLVPYGEYLPLRSWLEPLGLARVVPGDLDFWEGPGPRSFDLPGFGRVGIQICYEIVFSGEVVDDADRPDFLFNPSNDAWFGWWGPHQHLAQARLRALEEGLPVLRSTPTGVSALIDARGSLVASIPLGQQGVIDARLPPAAPPTLFARAGNVMPFAFALLLVAAALLAARLQSGSKRATERRT
jgi:apolipoprotein N-acyltransferase